MLSKDLSFFPIKLNSKVVVLLLDIFPVANCTEKSKIKPKHRTMTWYIFYYIIIIFASCLLFDLTCKLFPPMLFSVPLLLFCLVSGSHFIYRGRWFNLLYFLYL